MDDQRTDREGGRGDLADNELLATLSEVVTRHRNLLRKSSFTALQQFAPVSLNTEIFRDRRVCMAIATEKTSDEVFVLIRGFIWFSPHLFVFRGFTKHSDDSWTDLKQGDTWDELNQRIEQASSGQVI